MLLRFTSPRGGIAPRARVAVRLYSSGGGPCTRYTGVTHPDCVDAPRTSPVGAELHRFQQTTLGTYARPPVIFTHGKGLDLYARIPSDDAHGTQSRRYLDFTAGIAVNSLGHGDDQIAQVLAEQASRLVHSSNLYFNEASGELADRLVALTREHGGLGFAPGSPRPADGQDLKAFLANSGTEANEAALKFARKLGTVRSGEPGRKTALVCFRNAFHGRTMGALSVTPTPKYQAPFAPLVGDVRVGTLNDVDALAAVDQDTAGVIVEPIQGEGGIHPASVEWLAALRRRCDEVGAALVYDEIQCGLFRTGPMWCHSAMPREAHPHMVTMAKPLANGYPIGAVLLRPEVADTIVAGDHGTTFGGGALACRIAHHVLGRLSDEALRTNVQTMSSHLFARLERISELFPDLVGSGPRGRGLLVGLSLRDAAHVGRVVALARERGVLILSAGSDTLRFTPSLTVRREQVDEAMDVLESCLVVLRDAAK